MKSFVLTQVEHNNVDYGRELDDNTVYYEYEYEVDPSTDDGYNNAGTGDLYDPNSVKDDTAYYYEYSHQIYTPSESVRSKSVT